MVTKAGKIKSELVKKTDKYQILKKRSGKFAVLTNDKKWINGLEKAQILIEAGLIKTGLPKKEEAPAEEAKTEEKTEEKAEA